MFLPELPTLLSDLASEVVVFTGIGGRRCRRWTDEEGEDGVEVGIVHLAWLGQSQNVRRTDHTA